MDKKAVLVGALDTKGEEFLFVKEAIERSGVGTIVIDTGILEEPLFPPDISSGGKGTICSYSMLPAQAERRWRN